VRLLTDWRAQEGENKSLRMAKESEQARITHILEYIEEGASQRQQKKVSK
jgi:hypothetical protein